jgi:hypothetical protein
MDAPDLRPTLLSVLQLIDDKEYRQRDLRRLLITGAMSVARKGAPEGTWLASMLARKPRMLVAVALANKTARITHSLLPRLDSYFVVPAIFQTNSEHSRL